MARKGRVRISRGGQAHSKHFFHFSVFSAPDAVGQAGAQAELEAVHGDVVQHGIRPRQVDVLKDARARLPLRALLRFQLALLCSAEKENTAAHQCRSSALDEASIHAQGPTVTNTEKHKIPETEARSISQLQASHNLKRSVLMLTSCIDSSVNSCACTASVGNLRSI